MPNNRAAAPVSGRSGGENRSPSEQREHKRWPRRRQAPGETSIYKGLNCVGVIRATGGLYRALDGGDRVLGTYRRYRDAADAVLRQVLEIGGQR